MVVLHFLWGRLKVTPTVKIDAGKVPIDGSRCVSAAGKNGTLSIDARRSQHTCNNNDSELGEKISFTRKKKGRRQLLGALVLLVLFPLLDEDFIT